MRVRLHLHPNCASRTVDGVEVEIRRPTSGGLALHYVVTGAIAELLIPANAEPARADGLWQHSCFEAFLGDAASYLELNFSPSTQWAAYRFDAYRSGKRDAEIRPPRVETKSASDRFELRAAFEWPAGRRLGLSAVIEDKDGRKSYWALAHPPGAPDFHHPDCFVLELPPAV